VVSYAQPKVSKALLKTIIIKIEVVCLISDKAMFLTISKMSKRQTSRNITTYNKLRKDHKHQICLIP
jgi:hypothetical protein